LRHLVRVLAERGRAILYSTHIVENVERLCTRVLVLSAGRIVVDGNVDSIRTIAPSGSLEEAFATLASQQPHSLASEIAAIVTTHASAPARPPFSEPVRRKRFLTRRRSPSAAGRRRRHADHHSALFNRVHEREVPDAAVPGTWMDRDDHDGRPGRVLRDLSP